MQPKNLATAPRCLATTRTGGACQSPAVRGKRRCRMHGGTNPGAPKGNKRALKHGHYSREAVELRAALRSVLTDSLEGLADIDG
ncbi:MAG: hypothetical protein COW16_07145 [Sphingomonadales bacterium CG12_big_fil_rev_8_21_14_0_65_65_10]|nr:MAG: hypothetical protein COW16_07145 [Sphingomonadales bacterium CG12_big_fil_rev_8_21_14_0_65_65_10]